MLSLPTPVVRVGPSCCCTLGLAEHPVQYICANSIVSVN